ncbi:MAG: MFS transporter [Propionibacteriales bacterium]|nr:MFS transporter [Propionibacteriales bacterium]
MSDSAQPARTGGPAALIAVLLVALCLRPALTSVGPVLPQISADLDLGPQAQGVLGAIPLLAFAAASPLVHALTGRLGRRTVTSLALAGIIIGILTRSLPGPGWLWVGTVVVGVFIAIGNVVVSGLVKRDFADRVSLATGLYAAVMGIAAAFGSGLSAPLAHGLGGWRPGLAVWVVPAVVALVVWLLLGRADSPVAATRQDTSAVPSVWRSGLAWQVTGFFGLQAMAFYVAATWLPTMAISRGVPVAEAGWLLFVFQIVGTAFGPVATAWADRLADQRLLNAGSGLILAAAITGAVIAPDAVWVWAALAGAASGASFSLGLAMAPLRTSGPRDTVRLAGMAQSMGYLIAAVGPVAAGALAAATNWGVVLAVMATIAIVQAVLGFGAGADRRL